MDTSVILSALMDAVAWLWRGILLPFRWLFISECATATSLLSLSFAINSIFTGLSLSRFNLCTWMKRKALKCIDNSVNDKFLAKVERLGKDHKDISKQLERFSDQVECYRSSMSSESRGWELFRRTVTVICATAAFIIMAFESKTRIGFALVCPYIIFLLGHAVWVWCRTRGVLKSFKALVKAMDKIESDSTEEFDMTACINKLKENHHALSPGKKLRGKTSSASKSSKIKP